MWKPAICLSSQHTPLYPKPIIDYPQPMATYGFLRLSGWDRPDPTGQRRGDLLLLAAGSVCPPQFSDRVPQYPGGPPTPLWTTYLRSP